MRNYRGAIVEHVEHPKTLRKAVIRLDKRSLTFFAREEDTELQTEPFASKDGSAVRNWLMERLKFATDDQKMDWVPVIEIEQSGEESRGQYRDTPEQHSQSLQVEIDRYYIGLTHDQREWRKLEWAQCDPKSAKHIPENERYGQSRKYGMGPKSPDISDSNKPFRLPSFDDGYRRDKSVLLYTPGLWAGLMEIMLTLKNSRKTLKELLTTKDGISTIAEIGAGKAVLQLNPGKV